jgi:hypothetical protein
MTHHIRLFAAALLSPLSAQAHPGHVHAEEFGLVVGLLVAAGLLLARSATRFVAKRITAGAARSRI